MQTDIDMETNVDMDIAVKSVYIRAFGPREIKSNNKSFKHPKVTQHVTNVKRKKSILLSKGEALSLYT